MRRNASLTWVILYTQLLFFFCVFMDLYFVSAHKHPKELGQYPAIISEITRHSLNSNAKNSNLKHLAFGTAQKRNCKR